MSTEDGLLEPSELRTEWTSGSVPGVQIVGNAPWFSLEDRGRRCPTCNAPLRLIAWVSEYGIAAPRSRELDLALFTCNRPGCDPHRVELSYERDG